MSGDDRRVYIADLPFGPVAITSDGGVVEYELFPKAVDDAVAEAMRLEEEGFSLAHERLAKKLGDAGYAHVVVESEDTARFFSKRGFQVSVEPGGNVFVEARERLVPLGIELGFYESDEDALEWLYEVEVEYTRRKLRGAAQKRDMLAAQAIRAIDDIDKTVNLFVARLREWYSIHFPELNELVREHEDYVKMVSSLGHRDNFTVENLVSLGFSEDKAKKISEAAKQSIGADLSEFDVEAIQTLARITNELYQLRRSLTDYIEQVMNEVAPNITALVGPLLGARLISLAGGLDKLARMPASTVQVLGAEKALFRALRTGGKPPKHGVIFQYPDIHRSPKWQRGKIARALAAKLAIAAKVDAFTGRFIGDKLRDELRRRIAEIKKIYAKPPKRKREERPAPPRRGGRPFRRGRPQKRRGRGRGGRR